MPPDTYLYTQAPDTAPGLPAAGRTTPATSDVTIQPHDPKTTKEGIMGWIKDAKVDNVRKDAVDARNEGRNVLALKLNYPSLKPDFSGEVTVWSMMIQAVEEEGWVLYNFAASSDLKGRQEAICLFRPRT